MPRNTLAAQLESGYHTCTSGVHVPTEPSVSRDRVFRFGSFELSEREGELRKSGVRIKLQEQPFRVLVELVANAAKLVSREELQQKLWPSDTFVDFDVGLNSAIRKLRQALGDEADEPRFIETLSKRGYRFIVPVSEVRTGLPASEVHVPSAVPDQPTHGEIVEPSPRSGGASVSAAIRSRQRWYWVLGASVLLALAIVGLYLARQGTRRPPLLATEQRITANPQEAPIDAAVVSPDGKFVAYSDTTGVYVRHINTGETRPVQLPKDFNALPSSWFPDNTNLLLTRWPPTAAEEPSLWRVSILGGSPQKLVERAYRGAVSPDGSRIAFLRTPYYLEEIWVVGTDGSNPRRVVEHTLTPLSGGGNSTVKRQYAQSYISSPAWSPDGGRIAYVRLFWATAPVPVPASYSSLETVATSGGAPKVVKSSAHFAASVCWTADGRLIYPYREDGNSSGDDFGVWSLGVDQKTGEPVGEPRQISKGNGQIDWLSSTTDGKRLTFLRINTEGEVLLGKIDRATGRFQNPRRLTLDENANVVTAWTPDSRAVLFTSNRTGTWKIFRQAIDQVTAEVLVEGRNIFGPRLTPDGKQVLYLTGYAAEDPSRPVSMMAIPIEGGAPREVLHMPGILNWECARSPSKVCVLESVVGTRGRFYLFNPEDGKTQDFATFELKWNVNWGLSPDGSQLALCMHCAESKITFMALRNSVPHDVELKPFSIMGGMDWAADSQSLFVSGQTADRAPVILSVKPGGDVRVALEGNKGALYSWVIPSPDGRYGAVRARVSENNVWMAENP